MFHHAHARASIYFISYFMIYCGKSSFSTDDDRLFRVRSSPKFDQRIKVYGAERDGGGESAACTLRKHETYISGRKEPVYLNNKNKKKSRKSRKIEK